MSSLTLKNVSKRNSTGSYTLYNFNLSINDKEFFVITGPHKSGKSVLLRSIAGIEEITDGEIYINNTVVSQTSVSDRDVALLSRYSALYPHMSVFDNLAFGLKLKRFSKEEIDESVKKIAVLIGVSDILENMPDTLDEIQCRLIALGRILVRKPKILILDEPLFELDLSLHKKMKQAIFDLHEKTELTFIYVTENPGDVLSFNERIAVICDGTVKQVGLAKDLLQKPSCKFIVEFLFHKISFTTAKIMKRDKKITADICLKKVRVEFSEKNQIAILEKYPLKEIILGFRPQDFTIDPKGNAEGYIDCVETLADGNTYLYVVCDGNTFFILDKEKKYIHLENIVFDGREKVKPEKIKFFINTKNIYLFDAETEAVLSGE
jgi:multiple sugar transport system ATP-binding protein